MSQASSVNQASEVLQNELKKVIDKVKLDSIIVASKKHEKEVQENTCLKRGIRIMNEQMISQMHELKHAQEDQIDRFKTSHYYQNIQKQEQLYQEKIMQLEETVARQNVQIQHMMQKLNPSHRSSQMGSYGGAF